MTQETSTSTWVLAYLAALAAVAVLDGIWLGFLARDFYKQEMGALMTESVRIAPAAAFYLLYPAGLVFLVGGANPGSWSEALLRGAVVGLMAYGAYDMTNLATLKGWSLKLSLVDVAWGTFVSAAAAAAMQAVRVSR
ncbi:DUF2177 family protein [Variovorax sp. VNK109]|jgi:uncharacterized membrane protein|uniref:DUF2177 family protein n=1 Tax=Variovorax sp. VNK109 TaxID=3400919 RepID=UPI003C0995B3